MKRLPVYLAAGLLAWMVLVWLLGPALGLHGAEIWVFRALLWLIGIAATVLIFYSVRRARSTARTEAGPGGDLASLIAEAQRNLSASPRVQQGRLRPSALPVFLFIGDSGVGKTAAILNSDLSPELIAGNVFADGNIMPTRLANLWLAGPSILVEAGGTLMADSAALAEALRLLAPRTAANVLGSAAQAPRSIVVCCDCARFVASGARRQAQDAGRRIRAMIDLAAQQWDSRLPVYVLFTKLDEVRYFLDYFRNLRTEDAAQPFGAALPLAHDETGAYEQTRTRRLSDTFDSLVLSLADRRIEYLRSENDISRAASLYEFPREFRKMREALVQFLLEIGRPSQLRASPYLRGFYFTGVRPVAEPNAAGRVNPAPFPGLDEDLGATRILGAPALPAALANRPEGHRIPQWVFLSPVFSKVLLGDRAALTVSGRGANVRLARRGLAAAAIAASLVWIAGASVSYSHNRRLIDASERGAAAPAAQAIRLQRHGPPMSFRWGVYPGPQLPRQAVARYCAEIDRAVLGRMRRDLEAYLRALPSAPDPRDEFERPFETLRAYLMMTSESTHAEPDFLNRFLSGRTPDAAAQLSLYAAERPSNVCPASPDAEAIVKARRYLSTFPLADQVFATVVSDVSRQGSPYQFSDPAAVVVDSHAVPFAFTRNGWARMQAALGELSKYHGLEPWVIGEGGARAVSAGDLKGAVLQRYVRAYADQWQQHLAQATVPPFASLSEAAAKLNAITASNSPLLRLFCGISVNTNVDAPEIRGPFTSMHRLEAPASCETNLNDAPSQEYIGALVSFQVAVEQASKATPPPPIDSGPARVAAKRTASSLGLPEKGGQLLLDPILHTERRIVKGPNLAGENFCAQARSVLQRFPFRSGRSDGDATPADVARIFHPETGAIAALLKDVQDIVMQGSTGYVAKPGVPVRPDFLRFFNQAVAFSRALFSAGKPALALTIQPAQSQGIDRFTITVAGSTISGGPAAGNTQEVVWTPDDTGVQLAATVTGSSSPTTAGFSGPWAFLRLLAASDPPANGNLYQFPIATQTMIAGQAGAGSARGTARIRVDVKGHPGLLRNLPGPCVAQVVP